MWEQLQSLPLSWWVGMGVGILGSVSLVVYLWRKDKNLKPTPRPNRIPYDKDRFRK